jgi:glycosyltransferase involved in cell wall biosynthesis
LVISHARFPFNVVSLITAYAKIKSKTNIVIVGYGSFLLVPLAKLIAGVPVVYDALCPLIDPAIYSRSLHKKSILHLWRARFFDWLTFNLSDLVLLESNAQKKFVSKTYSISQSKLAVVYTGADDTFIHSGELSINPPTQVVFRGKFLPEAGVEYILQAAKLLENENISFTIIGNGFELKKIRTLYEKLQLSKVALVTKNLNFTELHRSLCNAAIMLGQFANNDRLNRTIPHKAFEAMALGKPYITADYPPMHEVLEHGNNGWLIKPADAHELAQSILTMSSNVKLRRMLSNNAYSTYNNRFHPKKLGEILGQCLEKLSNEL